MEYLISLILLVLVFFSKAFFVFVAKGAAPGVLEMFSMGVLLIIGLWGTFDFFKGLKLKREKERKTKSIWFKTLLFLSALAVILSFFVNLNKRVLPWDSVALYDARAKFLLQGDNFSQMVDFSKYDPANSYYYALYPPFTSVIHFFWYKLAIPLPIGFYYSSMYLLLAISVYLFARKELEKSSAMLLTFLTIGSSSIFSTSLLEYTNIPFTLQFFLGVSLLYSFLKSKKMWTFLFGIGLVVTSQWIRFLEPLWLGAVLVFSISLLRQKFYRRNVILVLAFLLYGFLEYSSWGSFVSSFGQSTKIVSFGFLHLLGPLLGMFTGSLLSVLIYFVSSWGLIFIVFLFAIYAGWKMEKFDFLPLFLFFCILIYFGGLYFVSFQSEWWNKLGDSLNRGSTFMIPIAGFVIFKYLGKFKVNEKK